MDDQERRINRIKKDQENRLNEIKWRKKQETPEKIRKPGTILARIFLGDELEWKKSIYESRESITSLREETLSAKSALMDESPVPRLIRTMATINLIVMVSVFF